MTSQITLADAPALPKTRLAAWMPAGMLDWPGRVAATLFIGGCDHRCAFCHNPDLLTPSVNDVDTVRSLFAYLEKRAAWIDGVVITGGEPCTDPGLESLLATLGSHGVPVKLDTNGSRPDVLERIIIDGHVEHVALDVKTVPDRYDTVTRTRDAWTRVERSISILRDAGISHEYRTTLYPGAVTLGDTETIAALLGGGPLYALQQFRPAHVLEDVARSTTPYHADAVRDAVQRCNRFIPTIVRGV